MRISVIDRFESFRFAAPGMPALTFCSTLFCLACSSGPAPLSITLEHPQTKHSLTCTAKDQLGRTAESVLAGAVENCARTLEARGYVRQK